MTTIGILEGFLKEKPDGGSWDDHRAWAGKVSEFLGEVYGDAVKQAFASIEDKYLAVVIERQCGKLLGLINKERSRNRRDLHRADSGRRPPEREAATGSEPVADHETHSSLQQDQVDVALLTALPLELEAILRQGDQWSMLTPSEDSPRTYHLSRTNSGVSIVATCALGTGQLNAALATRDIIETWHPKKVLLVGIAGGLGPDVQLGDIVVSEQIVDYELGKITPGGVSVRWSAYRSDPILLDRLRNFHSGHWSSAITVPRPDRCTEIVPRIIHNVVLSGNKVIADEKTAGALASVWKRAGAIEMEGAGIAAALHQIKNAPSFMVIKGICDKADSAKADDWQPYAADAAAAFTMSFVREALQPSDTAKPSPEKAPEVGVPGVDPRALRLSLSAAFSVSELKVLVSDLEVDWDDIQGQTKSERIVELIQYMKRRGRMPALIALVKRERPGLLESYSERADLVVGLPPRAKDSTYSSLPASPDMGKPHTGVNTRFAPAQQVDRSDYVFDKRTGIYRHIVTREAVCTNCLLQGRVSPLSESPGGWRCHFRDCGSFYSNPDFNPPPVEPYDPRNYLR
jgi:nucleoside phosphorylase